MKLTRVHVRILAAILIGGALLLLTALTSFSERNRQEDEERFAQAALEEYIRNFVTEETYEKFGFLSYGGALQAEVGKPYAVTMVEVDQLRGFEEGMGLGPMLLDVSMSWYPVIVDGRIRTKIEIHRIEEGFVAGEFGGTRKVQVAAGVIERLPEILKSGRIDTDESPLLVRLPILQAEFFYYKTPRGEVLIPAMINPERYGLSNGELYPVEELLPRLSDLVRKIPDDIID